MLEATEITTVMEWLAGDEKYEKEYADSREEYRGGHRAALIGSNTFELQPRGVTGLAKIEFRDNTEISYDPAGEIADWVKRHDKVTIRGERIAGRCGEFTPDRRISIAGELFRRREERQPQHQIRIDTEFFEHGLEIITLVHGLSDIQITFHVGTGNGGGWGRWSFTGRSFLSTNEIQSARRFWHCNNRLTLDVSIDSWKVRPKSTTAIVYSDDGADRGDWSIFAFCIAGIRFDIPVYRAHDIQRIANRILSTDRAEFFIETESPVTGIIISNKTKKYSEIFTGAVGQEKELAA